jgi:cell division protein FtsW
MENRVSKYFPVVTCVTSAILLAAFGLVCLYSALRGSLVVPVNILNKQILLLVVAILFGGVVAAQREGPMRLVAFGAMALSFVGLVIVLIPGVGVTVNGARRWIDLGFTHFQMSELAKATFVLGLAHYLSTFQRKKDHWLYGFMIPMGMIALFVGVILLEPDYGTAFLFGVVGVSMLYLWGGRLDLLVTSNVLGIALFAFLIRMDPVRWKRITSFLDVEGNKSDGAYQLYQGMLAFGSGGIKGVGIGNGRQQLAYLPEAHTDFILPVIGEEMGLIATITILFLFVVLFWSIFNIAKQTGSMFWYLIVTGGGSFIVYQALFNIGVVTGLLPTKGISLPFISYGGANLMGSFLILGLVFCAWRYALQSPIKKAREL